MELIFYLIVILILLITSLVLNENVKISGILNNIITRTIVLLGVVYTGNTRDYPIAVLLSILFVVLTNNSIETEGFEAMAQEAEMVPMSLELTFANKERKCLSKCALNEEDFDACPDFCENKCFLKCTSNNKNMSWEDCNSQCQ